MPITDQYRFIDKRYVSNSTTIIAILFSLSSVVCIAGVSQLTDSHINVGITPNRPQFSS